MANEIKVWKTPTCYEDLTKEYLDYLFAYNPETGELRNKTYRMKARPGEIAGCLHANGYYQVHINCKKYYVHKLIWLMVTGEHAPNEIDHINRIRNDNRWCNLRLATRFQNSGNTTIPISNTSGFKGVYWNRDRRRWRATIEINNETIYLGSFLNKEDASKAYAIAATKYFGEFANS